MKFERKKIAVALAYALGGTALVAGTAALAQTYTVTGSGIPRAEAEGALPVQVISKEEIARTGVQNVEQLIRRREHLVDWELAASTRGSSFESLAI